MYVSVGGVVLIVLALWLFGVVWRTSRAEAALRLFSQTESIRARSVLVWIVLSLINRRN